MVALPAIDIPQRIENIRFVTESSTECDATALALLDFQGETKVYDAMNISQSFTDARAMLYGDNAKVFFSKVQAKLKQKEVAFCDEILSSCSIFNTAFGYKRVRNFCVDYGKVRNALTYDVMFANGIRFKARTEVFDADRIVTFSIYRGGELLYMDSDEMGMFAEHVAQFFALEENTKHDNNQYSTKYKWGEWISSGIAASAALLATL